MATQVSILAWRIPCIEEPGGLQSWGGKESDTTERLILSFSYCAYTCINAKGTVWGKDSLQSNHMPCIFMCSSTWKLSELLLLCLFIYLFILWSFYS